jgi:3-hydroxyisobutyrate dehydrogenase
MAATDSHDETARVAVLGTGIMGSAMARNLVSAGLRTAVWDRSPRRLRRCPRSEHW